MPFVIVCTDSTSLCGTNVWLIEGKREICINYEYFPESGYLKYAAVVHRITEDDPKLTIKGIEEHQHTVQRRYEIRPVEMYTFANMDNDMLIENIRYNMCHGYGCKGSRIRDTYSEASSDTSSDTMSMLSETSEEEFKVSPETYNLKTIRHLKYYMAGKESRHIFISLKGRSSNGDVLFGASIMRTKNDPSYIPNKNDTKAHFATADSRLRKCPVQMRVSEEFKHQLKGNPKHREDIAAEIVDKIFERHGGLLNIRGQRI
jgi:hypothetical protein